MEIDLKDYIEGREDLFTITNVREAEEALTKFIKWYKEVLIIDGVPCRKINVLVTYYGEREPWQSKKPLYKEIFEVENLTEINEIFKGGFEDIKILN